MHSLDSAQQLVANKGVEYFLCSFVELSGVPKAKLVPATHLADMAQAGAGFEHVVRTRMFLARAEDWEEVGRAHGEVFGTIRPASTMVVAALLNPKWRVEVEAEAVLP